MSVYDGLVDDARLRAGSDPAAIAGHRSHPWVHSLVVPDSLLGPVDRLAPAGLRVCVVNSGGAGGLIALSRREFRQVRVVAVESELRDLDDLAGNAARVAAAGGELSDVVRVFVGLPVSYGWQRAVDVIEAVGLAARITLADLPAQAPLLVEADLPFKVIGGTTMQELDAALSRVLAIIEGVDSTGLDSPTAWPESVAARVRRRVERFDLADPTTALSGA